MIKKISYFLFAVGLLLLVGASIFWVSKNQIKTLARITSIFKLKLATSTNEMTSQETQEIAQLRQEIEKLKKQQTKEEETRKLLLTPAAPLNVDQKTQIELNTAKEQIKLLTQQLSQLQNAKTITLTSQPTTDADLLKSWQASDKVVQIACQFGSDWQLGSGVLISSDGKILTNQHVVQSSLGLTLPDYCLALFTRDFDPQTQTYKLQYRATVSGLFQDRDAALLKINDFIYSDPSGTVKSAPAQGPFSFFTIASSSPQIGDPVYVLGFPASTSFVFSVTKGIISNLTSDNLYFGTDAQIDRGNSGGAALNSQGQLIGLPTWKYVGNGDYRGYILNIQTVKLD